MEDVSLALLGLGVDLTLVNSGVVDIGVLDVQVPVDRVGGVGVNGPNAMVVGVHNCSHGQDMQIILPDPGNLKFQNNFKQYLKS